MASCIQSHSRIGNLAYRHEICLRCSVRKYIRTDTRKAYDDEVKIIDEIIAEKKLSPKQGKSAAYGIALQTWKNLRQVPSAVDELKAILSQVLEEQKQSYFVNQALVAQVAELRQVVLENNNKKEPS